MTDDIEVLRKKLAVVEELRASLIKAIASHEQASAAAKRANTIAHILAGELGTNGNRQNATNALNVFLSHGVADAPKIRTAMDAIRDAVDTLPNFTSTEIEDFIETRYPKIRRKLQRLTVANALFKLRKRGLLDQVERGTSGKPSRFTKKAGQVAPASMSKG